MIHNKQKLHAIGNYLRERFGYEWHFMDANSPEPSVIKIEGPDVLVRVTNKDFIVSSNVDDNTIARRLLSPMQVVNYIITRKYEVK